MADHLSRAASSILGLALVVLLSAGLTGCGSDDDTDTSATASNGTAAVPDDEGSGGSTDGSIDDDSDPGSGGSTNDLASGSGCTPGTETGLPDGRWYGFAEVTEDGRVDFDLACWFTGDAAVAAAAEDGAESPPPNDYYTRNVNPLVRTLEVAGGTMVKWYPDTGDPDSAATVTFDEWVTARADRAAGQLWVWIETQDGVITAIEEQWVP